MPFINMIYLYVYTETKEVCFPLTRKLSRKEFEVMESICKRYFPKYIQLKQSSLVNEEDLLSNEESNQIYKEYIKQVDRLACHVDAVQLEQFY